MAAVLVSCQAAIFEFDVIHPWLPCRHLAFGQLFDDCCTAPSSSGQHIHQFLYPHQAVVLSSRLRDVGVLWDAYNQLPSCRGSIQPVSLLITVPSFLIRLVYIFILLPCHHLCIWPALLLVATLQHLHKFCAFVDFFLIAAPPFFVRLANLLFAAPPFGRRPCQLSRHHGLSLLSFILGCRVAIWHLASYLMSVVSPVLHPASAFINFCTAIRLWQCLAG